MRKRQVAPPNFVRMKRLTKEQVLAGAKLKEKRIKQTEELKIISSANRKKYLEAEKERRKEHHRLRIKAEWSKGRIFYRRPDPKVALVIRIRGLCRISPKCKKILQLLRLRQIHNAVFIKLNASTKNMLKLILPYIAYGYPNRHMIEILIKKRGYACIRHCRYPINDNLIVDDNLGRHGVRCIEDVINSIWTVDENFRNVNRFLWPFKLSSPKGGYRGKKRRHFNEGGSYGNHEAFINEFVKKMF